MMDEQQCSDCGQVGFHACPHQQILWDIADRAADMRVVTDRLAREFWERAVTLPSRYADPVKAGQEADALTAEWRKRFDPEAKDGA